MQTPLQLVTLDDEPPRTLALAEILSSLSYALDLTSGQAAGHTERTCLIGMRLGAALGIGDAARNDLYHALLLKDAGCSSTAARLYEIFGSDDIRANHAAKIIDWSNLVEAVKYAAAHALPEGGLLARARRLLGIAGLGGVTEQLMESRCTRGAAIARGLGLSEAAAGCIHRMNEHWDGRGAPDHMGGDAIPILARIGGLAQTLDVFSTTFGPDHAFEVLRARSGRWFDPEIVRAAQSFRHDRAFWRSVRESPHEAVLGLEVEAATQPATDGRLDAVCEAFARIVDAKSGFTGEHSSRVCDVTLEIADGLGIAGARRTTLRRAALLHDIGKLAVPNTILDKNGKPTDEEWACIRRHPYHTEQVLGRISGFERLTAVASAHHERLDGRGYFRGLAADQLDLDMRIIAVADVYDALSEKRPYRDALPPDEVFAIMDRDALDPDCVRVLKDMGGRGSAPGWAQAA